MCVKWGDKTCTFKDAGSSLLISAPVPVKKTIIILSKLNLDVVQYGTFSDFNNQKHIGKNLSSWHHYQVTLKVGFC